MSRRDLLRFLEGADIDAAVASLGKSRDLTGAEFDAVLDGQLREAVEDYGVAAPLRRRLSLRLLGGKQKRNGRLGADVTEDLLDGLTREVKGAGGKGVKDSDLGLDLVGVGPGSTVLYFEPATDVVDPENDLEVEADPLDEALGRVFLLHATAEAQGDLRQFVNETDLLRGFQGLTDTLRAHGLELEMAWRDARGGRREASLSKGTLDWVSTLWDRKPDEREIDATGRVVALSLSGTFSIKVAPHRTARRYDISVPDGETGMMRLGLELGETVTVRIRERMESNELGAIKNSERHELVRLEPEHTAIQDS